ncbi:AraC family transcriptional regulator [Bacilli bacterium]|nr:transcriptional regulator [Bacilli bacterium VT-13-104]PZD81473.1 AraC family transcriptional regulator [Bacilli bacterium]PZD83456.1 AraC family transcriptional regulator [Bacilli bacterium]PZD85089.1 AraC family transcriptional regulator [Bacilli bacterium]RCO04497.1 AraC family transcriptional regulator [Bacilli bacterium]
MQYEEIINKTINYIEEHLHESLTMDDIAEQAGFSKFHFHRIFRTAVGMSITEYVRMRRLANASTALLYTNKRILDIAFYYHFESQEAFTRAFKKYYHLPPGQYRRLMSGMLKNKEESYMEKQVKGWFLSGSDPFNYEMGIDHEVVHQGKASGYIKSKTVFDSTNFATMMQQFKADKYIGKRVRLSCFLKTKDVESFTSMWMRVDNAFDDVLQFDNMSNRPIKGDTNWNRYSIVLDVPSGSSTISFGIILSGRGHVWVDQFTFEEVGKDVETTNLEIQSELLDEPLNLSFEEEI